MKVLFRSYELDTANIIIGSYIEENGFYMNSGAPDYNKPCTRHKICDEDGIYHDVAPEYLSINFEDMLASDSDRLLSNGKKDFRIFASLSEDGKGGDNLISYRHYFSTCEEWVDVEEVVKLEYGAVMFDNNPLCEQDLKTKVTGIKQ